MARESITLTTTEGAKPGVSPSIQIRFPDADVYLPWPRKISALWNIVEACNIDCGYCYGTFGGGSYKKDNLATFSPVRPYEEAILSLARSNVDVVHLVGGEPFLRKDLWDIAEAVKNHGMICHVTTNGTLYRESDRSRFREGAFDRVMTSIDTLSPDIGDRYREKTALVVRNIEKMIEDRNNARLNTEFGIYSVIHKGVVGEFEKVLKFAVDRGFQYICPQPMHLPKSHRLHDELSLGASELSLVREIRSICTEYSSKIRVPHDGFFELWERLLLHETAIANPCFAGLSIVYVSPNGMIARCPSYNKRVAEGFALGPLSSLSDRGGLNMTNCTNCSMLDFDCLCQWELAYACDERQVMTRTRAPSSERDLPY